MHGISLDRYDLAILSVLQKNSALTNSELGERVSLSPSQCSRRKARLEAEGVIKGYSARLDASSLGFGLRAITRVNLKAHGESMDDDFVTLLTKHAMVREAYSVWGCGLCTARYRQGPHRVFRLYSSSSTPSS